MMVGSASDFKMRRLCYGNRCYSEDPMQSISIDAYVLDVLMPDLVSHDRQPSAFLVYLRLWRATNGGRGRSAPLSLRELAEQTGLSKRGIQDAVDRLERRQLITVERAMPTAIPTYRIRRPWRRRDDGATN
jgi:Helix-turn-helix domain